MSGVADSGTFHPGLSTAATVTSVSGRGVGMDAVRAGVERVGGTVEIATEAGRGTRVRLRVPLTVAVTDALIVESGGLTFALPQSAVVELVLLDPDGDAMASGSVDVLRRHRRDDEVTGVLVDRVGDVVDVEDATAHDVPATVPATLRRQATAAVEVQGQLVLVLDEVALRTLDRMENSS